MAKLAIEAKLYPLPDYHHSEVGVIRKNIPKMWSISRPIV